MERRNSLLKSKNPTALKDLKNKTRLLNQMLEKYKDSGLSYEQYRKRLDNLFSLFDRLEK